MAIDGLANWVSSVATSAILLAAALTHGIARRFGLVEVGLNAGGNSGVAAFARRPIVEHVDAKCAEVSLHQHSERPFGPFDGREVLVSFQPLRAASTVLPVVGILMEHRRQSAKLASRQIPAAPQALADGHMYHSPYLSASPNHPVMPSPHAVGWKRQG